MLWTDCQPQEAASSVVPIIPLACASAFLARSKVQRPMFARPLTFKGLTVFSKEEWLRD